MRTVLIFNSDHLVVAFPFVNSILFPYTDTFHPFTDKQACALKLQWSASFQSIPSQALASYKTNKMAEPPIIIIEDDADDRFLLEEAFREIECSFSRIYFSSGWEAFDYLLTTKEVPMLIISDVSLPVMNGFELKQMINDNNYLKKKSIPFIFLSEWASKKAVQVGYQQMVQGYFVKPSNFEDLKELLRLIGRYWSNSMSPAAFQK